MSIHSEWKEAQRKPIRILTASRREGGRKFVVNSSSDARKHYIVTCKNGNWSCSCFGWIIPRKPLLKNGKPVFRKDGKPVKVRVPCRHIIKIKGAA